MRKEVFFVRRFNILLALLLLLAFVAACGDEDALTKEEQASIDSSLNLIRAEKYQMDRIKEAGAGAVIVGYVGEIPVYEEEFRIRYQLAVSAGISNPYEDTVRVMVLLKTEKALADLYGLAAEKEEVEAYLRTERKITEEHGTKVSKAFIKQASDILGLTEDEYWNEYRPKDAERTLNHEKVARYFQERGMEPLDPSHYSFVASEPQYEKEGFISMMESQLYLGE